jgi:hypothetical protein
MLDYEDKFHHYEGSRSRYAALQDDLRDFLARFTASPDDNGHAISVRDLATLEGLRVTRDIAFAEYALAEAEVIKRLLAAGTSNHD